MVATAVTLNPEEARDEMPPIGRPIDNTRVYLLDKDGSPTPIGLPGELCVGGVGLARGYLNNPEFRGKIHSRQI